MKLIWSGSSPYARKCMIIAHELGLAEKLELVNGTGTPIAPNAGTVAYNPLGKLPCLVPEDGPAIFDSRVICQFLIENSGNTALLARSGPKRYATLTLEALADGILDAALLMRYETVLRAEEGRSADWLAGQDAKIDRALEAVSERWMGHMNGGFDLGQAAMGCALAYLDFRFGEKDWRGKHPALVKWYEGFETRGSVAATVPEG